MPSTTGMPSDKEALNLSNALKSFELWSHYFNNIMLVDNEQFEQNNVTRESVEQMYTRANTKLPAILKLSGDCENHSMPGKKTCQRTDLARTIHESPR